MVRRWTIVVLSEAIGRPLRTVAATRTSCTSAVAASTQARTAASSTTVGWCVASLGSMNCIPKTGHEFLHPPHLIDTISTRCIPKTGHSQTT